LGKISNKEKALSIEGAFFILSVFKIKYTVVKAIVEDYALKLFKRLETSNTNKRKWS